MGIGTPMCSVLYFFFFVYNFLCFTYVYSWMVTEHKKQGHSEELLSNTFSLEATGNGLVAVFAGLSAQGISIHNTSLKS